jgi:hypothetical protein
MYHCSENLSLVTEGDRASGSWFVRARVFKPNAVKGILNVGFQLGRIQAYKFSLDVLDDNKIGNIFVC